MLTLGGETMIARLSGDTIVREGTFLVRFWRRDPGSDTLLVWYADGPWPEDDWLTIAAECPAMLFGTDDKHGLKRGDVLMAQFRRVASNMLKLCIVPESLPRTD